MIKYLENMNDYKKKTAQKRATFNDTLSYQEDFRIELDRLEKENTTVDDQGNFFELFGRSLLGLEYEKTHLLILPDGTDLTITDISEFVRRLSYVKSNKVGYDFFKYYTDSYNKNKSFDIKDIWYEIKFIIFGIYSPAITLSVKSSKEITKYEPAQAAKV